MDKTNKIKYVFSNEFMEYLNGSEAARIIRKMEENNKIPHYNLISVTTLTDDQNRFLLLNSGFNNIIPKPSSYSDILNIFNNSISYSDISNHLKNRSNYSDISNI